MRVEPVVEELHRARKRLLARAPKVSAMRDSEFFVSRLSGVGCGAVLQIILACLIAIFTTPAWIVATPLAGALFACSISALFGRTRREFLWGMWISLVPLTGLCGLPWLLFASGIVFVQGVSLHSGTPVKPAPTNGFQ